MRWEFDSSHHRNLLFLLWLVQWKNTYSVKPLRLAPVDTPSGTGTIMSISATSHRLEVLALRAIMRRCNMIMSLQWRVFIISYELKVGPERRTFLFWQERAELFLSVLMRFILSQMRFALCLYMLYVYVTLTGKFHYTLLLAVHLEAVVCRLLWTVRFVVFCTWKKIESRFYVFLVILIIRLRLWPFSIQW